MGMVANLRNRVWILIDENRRKDDEIQSLRDYISKLEMELYAEREMVDCSVGIRRNLFAQLEKISRYANRLWTENNELRTRKNREEIWHERALKWRRKAIEFRKEAQRSEEKAEYNRGLIQFWRSMCKRNERKAETFKRAMEDTQSVVDFKNHEIAELKALLLSVRTVNVDLCEELAYAIEDKRRMENDAREVARDNELVEIEVFLEPCEITSYEPTVFEMIPDAIGFAPCGNGCYVKRDSSGSMYDAHESHCDMSDENEPVEF